jgi:membrane protease YdiL (CAAX protease family)
VLEFWRGTSDYLHIILIFFFAWLLAFLVAPPRLAPALRHLPRAVAVLAVIVPVIVIGALSWFGSSPRWPFFRRVRHSLPAWPRTRRSSRTCGRG